jgi:hypothetical protein
MCAYEIKHVFLVLPNDQNCASLLFVDAAC